MCHQGVAFLRCDVTSGNSHEHLEIKLHVSSVKIMEEVGPCNREVKVL